MFTFVTFYSDGIEIFTILQFMAIVGLTNKTVDAIYKMQSQLPVVKGINFSYRQLYYGLVIAAW